MKRLLFLLLLGGSLSATGQTPQTRIPRIERMPRIPQPYDMRDWKATTADYVDLVLCPHEGDLLPLATQERAGINYPHYQPLYVDTYVGWNAHGKGSEAINTIPAVVSAYLTGHEGRSTFRLTEGIMDFFNARNGQNVYLNNFSSRSGSDWWYDVMPNVYFYQLCHLAEMPAEAADQRRSVADQWLRAVYSLGGNPFWWQRPDMNHRAFDLATQRPRSSGVKEPESAGSIAWLLYHAYLETGDDTYRAGAELALEFLNNLTTNPAYELQLAYGVQAAAKMNAREGTDYDLARLFRWCFDRGPLRGWGCIVGQWDGYDVSGLIGEANGQGNDYAFVMNGFQQAAALAPVPKYDKRLARAYARWMLNVANASRLFYPDALGSAHQEAASRTWSLANDPRAAIPFEAMKEQWEGQPLVAMGDAVKGKWASTNLSLYSGSSVGYLAAVVEATDVEAILQLDLNRTDLDGQPHLPTYLYYNPYDEDKTVRLDLPEGSFRLYDAIGETFLDEEATGAFSLHLPADSVRLLTLVPRTAVLREEGRRLYADDVVIDWHRQADFSTPVRIKHLGLPHTSLQPGQLLTVRAVVDHASPSCRYTWQVDGIPQSTLTGTFVQFLPDQTPGLHTLTLQAEDGGHVSTATAHFTIEADAAIDAPSSPTADYAVEEGRLVFHVAADHIRLYTPTGMEAKNAPLAPGLYLLHYRKGGRPRAAKVLVP